MRRSSTALACTFFFVAAAAVLVHTHASVQAQSPCGQMDVNLHGSQYRILFARNGAVQRYQLLRSSNAETDHDALMELQNRYGPEEVNAPPLRIVEWKDGGNGMRVPVKAVDSCGRVSSFE